MAFPSKMEPHKNQKTSTCQNIGFIPYLNIEPKVELNHSFKILYWNHYVFYIPHYRRIYGIIVTSGNF